MRVLYVATDLRDADILKQEVRRASPELTFDLCVGLAALRTRQDQPSSYDILLMDCALPEAEQLQLIHHIRVRQLALPIVALSPANGAAPSAALSAGADDFVPRGKGIAERLTQTLRLSVERYRTLANTQREHEKVKRSETRLRLIIEALPTGVLLLDGQGKVLAMNAAGVEYFGSVSPTDIVGRTFFTLIPVEDHPSLRTFLDAVNNGEEASMQFSSLVYDEAPQVFNLRGLCIEREQAGSTAVLGVVERVGTAATGSTAEWSADLDLGVSTDLPSPLLDLDAPPGFEREQAKAEPAASAAALAEAESRAEAADARAQTAESRASSVEAELAAAQAALREAEAQQRAALERLQTIESGLAVATTERDESRQALAQAEEQRRALDAHVAEIAAREQAALEQAARSDEQQREAIERATRSEELHREATERATRSEELQREASERAARSEELHRELTERAARSEELHREATERAARSEEQQREAAERAARGEELHREQAERAARGDELHRELAERAAQAEMERQASDARVIELDGRLRAAEERVAQAEAQQRQSEERAAQAEAQQHNVEERAAQAEARAREVSDALRAQERAALQGVEAGEVLAARLASLEGMLRERETLIEAKQTTIAERDTRLAETEAEASSHAARVVVLERALLEKDALLDAKQAVIAEKDVLITEQDAELAARATRLAEATTKAESFDGVRAGLDRAREELEASRAELGSMSQTLAAQREANERLQVSLTRKETDALAVERRAQARIAELEREHRAAADRLQDLIDQAAKESATAARGLSADPARRGSERLGRLAAAMAGDLHAAVGAAAEAVRALAGASHGDAARQEAIARALDTILRCGELARHLLRLSTRYMSQSAGVDLGHLVQQQESLLRHLAGPDIELHCDLTPRLISSDVDSQDLTHVLTSLIVAARDALPLGGTIRVATSSQPVDLHAHEHGGGRDRGERGGDRPRPLVLAVSARGYGIRPVSSTTCEEVTERCGGLLTTVIEPNVSWTLMAMLPGTVEEELLASHDAAPAELTRSRTA